MCIQTKILVSVTTALRIITHAVKSVTVSFTTMMLTNMTIVITVITAIRISVKILQYTITATSLHLSFTAKTHDISALNLKLTEQEKTTTMPRNCLKSQMKMLSISTSNPTVRLMTAWKLSLTRCHLNITRTFAGMR